MFSTPTIHFDVLKNRSHYSLSGAVNNIHLECYVDVEQDWFVVTVNGHEVYASSSQREAEAFFSQLSQALVWFH